MGIGPIPCTDLHLMSIAKSVTDSENTCCFSVLEPSCYAFSIEQTGPNNCHTSCQSKRLANEHDVSCHLQYAEVSSKMCTQCAAPFANLEFQTHVQCNLHHACYVAHNIARSTEADSMLAHLGVTGMKAD